MSSDGKKTESEKFAGGLYTTTVEAFIPATGRGIQGATSHWSSPSRLPPTPLHPLHPPTLTPRPLFLCCVVALISLGQNFAHMFDIKFEDEKGVSQFAWQNSWGLTTRTIGVMVMVHSDDRGLVLPPMVAPLQVIFVPIFKKTMDLSSLLSACRALKQRLLDVDVRADVDERDNYNPGWKFNHWELKGVCLRVEIGDNELSNHLVTVQRRDRQGKEQAVTFSADDLEVRVKALLQDMQQDLLVKATEERDARRKRVTEWKEFMRALDSRCTALAPHCESAECEKRIKQRSGEAAEVDESAQEVDEEAEARADSKTEKLTGAAKSLCIPFEQPDLPDGTRCIGCDMLAKNWTLFGRSY